MNKCTNRTVNAQEQIFFTASQAVNTFVAARFLLSDFVGHTNKNGVNLSVNAVFRKQSSYFTAPTVDMKECDIAQKSVNKNANSITKAGSSFQPLLATVEPDSPLRNGIKGIRSKEVSMS